MGKSVLKQIGKATKSIVLRKNVMSAAMTGNPYAVAGAVAANGAQFGASKVSWKQVGVKKYGVNKGRVNAVTQRLSDAAFEGKPLVNKGDAYLAGKYAIRKGVPMVAKKAGANEAQTRFAQKVARRGLDYGSGKTDKLVNKGDVRVAASYGIRKGIPMLARKAGATNYQTGVAQTVARRAVDYGTGRTGSMVNQGDRNIAVRKFSN